MNFYYSFNTFYLINNYRLFYFHSPLLIKSLLIFFLTTKMFQFIKFTKTIKFCSHIKKLKNKRTSLIMMIHIYWIDFFLNFEFL